MKSPKYQQRFYRQWGETKDLVSFEAQVSESDLRVRAKADLTKQAEDSLLKYRKQLEDYIRGHPEFRTTLAPYPVEPLAPRIVREMSAASFKANVGPMAAVAGAVADFVGNDLLKDSDDVIVENGGDVFLKSTKARVIALYAGKHLPAISISLEPERTPCGVCTSSGTLGHSLSLGKADSVTIIAETAALADAVATATGNRVQTEHDLESALERALAVEGVSGAIITIGRKIGIKGNVVLDG